MQNFFLDHWDGIVDVATLCVAIMGVLVSAGLLVRRKRTLKDLIYVEQERDDLFKKNAQLTVRLNKVDPERFIDRINDLESTGKFSVAEDAALEFTEAQSEAFGRAALVLAEQRLIDAPDHGVDALNDALRFASIGLAADPASKRLKGFVAEAQCQHAALKRGEPIEAAKLDDLDWEELGQLAGQLISQSRFLLGEIAARRAVALTLVHNPEVSSASAWALWRHGVALRHLAHNDEALLLLKRAVGIAKKLVQETMLSGIPDASTNDMLNHFENSLAVLYSGMDRYEDAYVLHNEILSRIEADTGRENENYALHLRNICPILMYLDRYEEAEKLCREALNLTARVDGKKTAGYGAALNNLAQIFGHMGDKTEAETLHREALKVKEMAQGTQHVDYAVSQTNLGGLLLTTDRAEEALPLFRAALAVHRNAYDGMHPEIAKSLNNLGWALLTLGKPSKAASRFLEAGDMYAELYGPDSERASEMHRLREQALAQETAKPENK